MMYADPQALHLLLDVGESVTLYLNAQIKAGVKVGDDFRLPGRRADWPRLPAPPLLHG